MYSHHLIGRYKCVDLTWCVKLIFLCYQLSFFNICLSQESVLLDSVLLESVLLDSALLDSGKW